MKRSREAPRALPTLPAYAPTPDKLLARILGRCRELAGTAAQQEAAFGETGGPDFTGNTWQQDEARAEVGQYLAEEVRALAAWIAAGERLPRKWATAQHAARLRERDAYPRPVRKRRAWEVRDRAGRVLCFGTSKATATARARTAYASEWAAVSRVTVLESHFDQIARSESGLT